MLAGPELVCLTQSSGVSTEMLFDPDRVAQQIPNLSIPAFTGLGSGSIIELFKVLLFWNVGISL